MGIKNTITKTANLSINVPDQINEIIEDLISTKKFSSKNEIYRQAIKKRLKYYEKLIR